MQYSSQSMDFILNGVAKDLKKSLSPNLADCANTTAHNLDYDSLAIEVLRSVGYWSDHRSLHRAVIRYEAEQG